MIIVENTIHWAKAKLERAGKKTTLANWASVLWPQNAFSPQRASLKQMPRFIPFGPAIIRGDKDCDSLQIIVSLPWIAFESHFSSYSQDDPSPCFLDVEDKVSMWFIISNYKHQNIWRLSSNVFSYSTSHPPHLYVKNILVLVKYHCNEYHRQDIHLKSPCHRKLNIHSNRCWWKHLKLFRLSIAQCVETFKSLGLDVPR